MKGINHLAEIIFNKYSGWIANYLQDSLKSMPLTSILRMLNQPKNFHWTINENFHKIEGFEDLTFLFWSSPLNRGIIRMDLDEAAYLFKHIKTSQCHKGVEIGRFNGGSTFLLVAAMGSRGKLVSIDIEPKNDIILCSKLKQYGLLNCVELIKGDAQQVIRDEEYDFVFIDGDHSYEAAKKDHNKWGKLVKNEGYIIHHDMANARQCSTQVDDLAKLRADIIEKQKNEIEIVKEIGSLTIFRRNSKSWTDI